MCNSDPLAIIIGAIRRRNGSTLRDLLSMYQRRRGDFDGRVARERFDDTAAIQRERERATDKPRVCVMTVKGS